jgi:hypothetical protein
MIVCAGFVASGLHRNRPYQRASPLLSVALLRLQPRKIPSAFPLPYHINPPLGNKLSRIGPQARGTDTRTRAPARAQDTQGRDPQIGPGTPLPPRTALPMSSLIRLVSARPLIICATRSNSLSICMTVASGSTSWIRRVRYCRHIGLPSPASCRTSARYRPISRPIFVIRRTSLPFGRMTTKLFT